MDQKELQKQIEKGLRQVTTKNLTKNIMMAGTVFLLVCLLAAGWFFYRKSQNKKFDAFAFGLQKETQIFVERYANAQKMFGDEKAEAEAREFRAKMIQNYETGLAAFAGNSRARFMHLELAHLLVKDKQFDKATQHYTAFLNTLPKTSPYRGMVLQNLAFCAEQNGQLVEAHQHLLEAEGLGAVPIREFVLFRLGQVEEKMGKKQEAQSRFQTLAKEFPKSILITQVQNRLIEQPASGEGK